MIDRISCLLVSFVDAQSKLDHAVDPLGVHSRLLNEGLRKIDGVFLSMNVVYQPRKMAHNSQINHAR